jgi:hypothetical protein
MEQAVFQTTLNQLAGLLVQHCNPLVSRVLIKTYNLHGSERSKSTQRLWSGQGYLISL